MRKILLLIMMLLTARLSQAGNYPYKLYPNGDALVAGAINDKNVMGTVERDTIPETERVVTPDTGDYKIVLSPRARFWHGDTVFYQLIEPTADTTADRLINHQALDTTMKADNIGTRNYGFTGPLVIDLGGYYALTDIYVMNHSGNAYLDLLPGIPMSWSTDTISHYTAGPVWQKANKKTIYTRYLKIFWDQNRGGYNKVSEMLLYGHLVRDSLSRTAPSDIYRNHHKLRMADFMGANIWGGIPLGVLDIGNVKREYVPQSYNDTSLYIHDVDSIPFTFDKYGNDGKVSERVVFPEKGEFITQPIHPNNLQWYLRQAKAHGWTWFFCLSSTPSYLASYHHGYNIDKIEHHRRDSVDARQYDRLARMGWNLAAVFGRNKYPKDSLQVTYPDSSGLDLMDYVETGNEMNGTWGTPYQYYSPEMFEAYSSAIYDGNAGAMGSRMGIKTADDSIQVVMAGTAGVHPERLKAFYYFSRIKRPDHKLPVDVINFHQYFRTLSPEDSKPRETYAYMDSVAHETCPGCEIWLTEWGFGRNHASSNHVATVPGRDSAQVQADWVARYWFLLSLTDITRATYYQIRNEPTQHYLDTGARGAYQSMGLTDGHRGSYTAFPVYYYVHTIVKTLGDYREDSLVYFNEDSLYMIRYRNMNHSDSVCYVVWSGTQTGRTVSRYLKTGRPNTSLTDIHLVDKKMFGDTTTLTTVKGIAQLTITETPQLLFTAADDLVSLEKRGGRQRGR